MSKDLLLGTCSWNYDSWVGLVYSAPKRRAVEYLPEYASRFDTVEVDSWYYRIPDREEAKSYFEATPESFVFTCKVVQDLTIPFKRNFPQKAPLEPNPGFLSPDVFHRYCEGIEPLRDKIALLMFEFEYLNREKMESLSAFLDRLDSFLARIDRSYRIGVETRNKNYLTDEYFAFLQAHGVEHVFSEKQYMPPVYEVYDRFKQYLGEYVVVRLMGGDRAQMEEKTGEQWNRIVEEKPDKDRIVRMSLDARYSGRKVILNVNNHYEGSAPLTIEALRRLFEQAS